MVCKFCSQEFCNCHNLMTRTTENNGRFCNQLIRNMATSFIAQHTDLYVEYSNFENFKRLGIPLYVGNKIYPNKIYLNVDNYFEVLNNAILVNLDPNFDYFQTREISQMIYNFFRENHIKNEIIEKNPYKTRYNSNNDCFIHVRLGDIIQYGNDIKIDYYLKALKEVGEFDRLYIATDSPDNEIINIILDTYSGRSELVLKDEVETIQLGSICRHVVLSHGTFSAVIGWLAFFSNVYYPEYIEGKMWHGDVFSVNPEWKKIVDYTPSNI